MTYKGYLISLDGTIYKEEQNSAGEAFVHELEAQDSLSFVTNNTTRMPKMAQTMLAEI